MASFPENLSLPSKTRRHLIAVSGGRDSIALLHALHALGYKKLVVLHLDHRLRGRVSAADARFVARFALRLGYPILTARADVRRYAQDRGLSLELAARELRHVFFEAAARRTRCRRVFLAHHADDQIETCLLNFLRGTGAAGLAGMRPETQLGRRLTLLRPLLEIRRAEIDAYLAAQRIPFREDATNHELAATRNRLRHRVLPAIREATGDPAAILRAAEILAAENDWLERETAKIPLAAELPTSTLQPLPLALLRRVLRRWLALHGFPPAFELVERVRALLAPEAKTAKVNLPGGAHGRRRAGTLFIERRLSPPL